MIKSITLLFIAISIITGCSTNQFYQSAKQHQVDQCQKLTSDTEYNDCMKRTKETFNEYNKKREDVLKK